MITTSWPVLQQQIEECERCSLCKTITHKVPGQGNPKASLMIIGEGPGADEDKQGLAFVGAAGQLLTRMLAAIQLSREEVYITNVVKCRPPQNRVPSPEEIACCLPHLRAQTALIRPQILLLLGATALGTVLGRGCALPKPGGNGWNPKGCSFCLLIIRLPCCGTLPKREKPGRICSRFGIS